MSERLSDINSMFNVPRNTLGEIIMQHVRGRLEQGCDSDNLRPFRSIGGLAGDLVAQAISKQRAAEFLPVEEILIDYDDNCEDDQ